MKNYEEDNVLLLITSLIDSYENFVKIILHGKDTTTLEQ